MISFSVCRSGNINREGDSASYWTNKHTSMSFPWNGIRFTASELKREMCLDVEGSQRHDSCSSIRQVVHERCKTTWMSHPSASRRFLAHVWAAKTWNFTSKKVSASHELMSLGPPTAICPNLSRRLIPLTGQLWLTEEDGRDSVSAPVHCDPVSTDHYPTCMCTNQSSINCFHKWQRHAPQAAQQRWIEKTTGLWTF